MRRSKFVELVSASLDGELSDKEMELLRRELATNPEHRALYASYKRVNKAMISADFPVPEPVATPVAYRHSFAVSAVSWCAAGAFAGVLATFILLVNTRGGSRMEDQFASVEISKPVVVTNDVARPVERPVIAAQAPILAQRTPIEELAAATSYGQNAFSSSHAIGLNPVQTVTLTSAIGKSPAGYPLTSSGSFTQPSAIYTPVTFAPVADH